MSFSRTALAAAVLCCAIGGAVRAEPAKVTKLWETAGFKNPESALPDAEAGVVYVSNVNGEGTAKDGNGFISKVSPDGKVQAMEWVTGLDAPKGMAKAGGKLFVADIDKLVEIDIASGKAVKRYDANGAKFLNDVAADAEGHVYVSDMATNTIWRLAGGTFDVFVADAKLESPNGLLVEGDRLIVGAWGVMGEGFATKVPGHLKTVALKDKAIAPLGSGKPVGNLDAVEPLADGVYLVTDWMAGKVLRIAADGTAVELADLGPGTADLGYDRASKTAFIPQMKTGMLYGYKVE